MRPNIFDTVIDLHIVGKEPLSTAERSENVENFLFRATGEYTEAGIGQATVAMLCHRANSREPRRLAVAGSDTSALHAAATSALRAAHQQLYNRTSLTSWAHRGSLSNYITAPP